MILRRQREEYGKFSKAAGLLTQNDRTQVYGYDRSKSAKTVWAERKANGKANDIKVFNIPSQRLDKGKKIEYNFDVEKARSDTLNYLSAFPSNTANQKIYSYIQGCTLQENTLIDCPYKYDRNHNRILYNPKIEGFSRYDPIESILHESAHAIDSTYYKSFANLSFSQNIIDTMMILDKKGLYNAYTNSTLMKNSYLSDIISALTENDPMFFLCGYHENKYWKIPGNREAEIFANIFTLQAQNNTEAIDFIKNHFSDVYDAFMTIIGG